MSQWGSLLKPAFYRAFTVSIVSSLTLLSINPVWAQETLDTGAVMDTGAVTEVQSTDATATETTSQSDNNSNNAPNNNLQAEDTGVAINGEVKDSTVNNNKNDLTTGNNTNLNLIAPSTSVNTPTQNAAAALGGLGGNAVLMMPRNPLPLSNAALGRSNFGLQFGLQNNPILGGLNGFGGNQNALGWFLQGGVTIPFGKIPDVLRAKNAQFDDLRQQHMDQQRHVIGQIAPSNSQKDVDGFGYQKKVKARVSGMSAYNYNTIPSSKITLPDDMSAIGLEGKLAPPKLLALSPAEVYSRPLNTGDRIGIIEVGNEYPYLGHTRSGWVKVLLPNGSTGWTSTHFEYIKNDYTEIDDLAVDPAAGSKTKTAHRQSAKKVEQKADSGDSSKKVN